MHRYLVVMTILLLSVTLSHAQENTTWCEIAPDDVPERPPVIDREAMRETISNILPLTNDQNSYMGYNPDVILESPDGTLALTGYIDEDTLENTLVMMDLVKRTIVYEITPDDLETARPSEPPYGEDDAPDTVWTRNYSWLDNKRVIYQSLDFYYASGEYTPPPDDLQMITSDGEIITLVEKGDGGNAIISPDRQHIAIVGRDTLRVVEVETQIVHEIAVQGYYIDPEMSYRASAPVVSWQNNDTFTIMIPMNFAYGEKGFVGGWREFVFWEISTTDWQPEYVNRYENFIITFNNDRESDFISLAWVAFDEYQEPTQVFPTILDAETGAVLYAPNFSIDANIFSGPGNWLWYSDTPILRLYAEESIYVTPCAD